MAKDKSETRGGHAASAEAGGRAAASPSASVPPQGVPRTPKLRKLPPRTDAKAGRSRDGSGLSKLTGGLTLRIIKYAYPLVGVLLIGGVGAAVWMILPGYGAGPAANKNAPGNSGNLFSELEGMRPVAVGRGNPDVLPAKDQKSAADDAPLDVAKSPSNRADGIDVSQVLKLLKSVKRPSTARKDLAQLRDLMKALKKRKGAAKLANIAQLSDLLKSMTDSKSAPKEADPSELLALLSQLEQKGGACDSRDVERVRSLLNRFTGPNAPVNPDDPQAVKDLLGEIVPDPSRITPEAIDTFRETLKQVSAKTGPLELGDLNNFAKLIQERTGPDGTVDVGDAHEVLEVLKDLTGKKASPYVDFLSVVTGADQADSDSQSSADLQDMNHVDATLTKLAGDGTALKLKNLEAPAARELGKLVRDLKEKSAGKSAADVDAQAAQLSSLIEKMTGAPVKVAAADLIHFRNLLEQSDSKRSTPRQPPLTIPGLATLIVDPSGRSSKAFKTLNEALDNLSQPGGLSQAGALILLVGDGPFPLKPTRIRNKRQVVIASSGEDLPIIHPGPADPALTAALQVEQGTLELRGVHFAWDAPAISASSGTAMVAVAGGDLLVANCSFTFTGSSSANIAAMSVRGRNTAPAEATASAPFQRVVIENTLVRGDGLTALQLDLEPTEVEVRNSLFVTGKAAGVMLDNRTRANVQAERTLRFTATTLCCRGQALSLAAGTKPANPVPTHLIFVDSLIVAESAQKGQGAEQGQGALLGIKDWPRESGKGRPYHNLDWQSQGTVFLGWNALVQERQETVAKSPAEWLTLWKESPDTGHFATNVWPKTPIAEPADFELALLNPETLPVLLRIGSGGSWPGCPIDLLWVPERAVSTDSPAPAAAALWAGRPKFPDNLFPPATNGATVAIDLGTQDLGQLISSSDWPDGTVFLVSGSGVRQSSPLAVRGKTLRLHFQQTADDPLVLVPRFNSSRTAPKGAARLDDAFISVRNGSLEIVNGMLGSSATIQGNAVLPRWIVQVVDGNLALQNCRIKGPLTGSSRSKGLIQWVRTLAAPSARTAGRAYEAQASLVDTFLSGSGTLIDADIRQRALFVHNCVAVGSQIVSLNIGGTDSAIAAAVDLHHSTFSALGTVFNVQADKLSLQTSQPLQIFSDHCLFVSPFNSAALARASTLMRYAAPALAQKQLVWREYANGYSAEIQTYLQKMSPKGPTESLPYAAWVGTWGADQIRKPLVKPDGVRLKAELPRRDRIEAIHFELDPACPAATWGDHATPLGAILTKAVEQPEAEPPGAQADPQQAPKQKESSPKGL